MRFLQLLIIIFVTNLAFSFCACAKNIEVKPLCCHQTKSNCHETEGQKDHCFLENKGSYTSVDEKIDLSFNSLDVEISLLAFPAYYEEISKLFASSSDSVYQSPPIFLKNENLRF